MSKRSGLYPRVRVDAAGRGVVSHAGGSLLTAMIGACGLDVELPAVLAPWRKPLAVHDPGKVVLDLAVAVAVAVALGLGGDCLADIALVRAEPGVFGPVASDPTVSRTIDVLAADAPAALRAIHAARAAARARAWQLAGEHAPHAGIDATHPIVIDIDATLVTAHSDKEGAAATFKRGWGHHPLWAFVDHGPDGTGEPLAVLLRPGNAGSNTAADHLVVIREALRQLPFGTGGWVGRKVLVRRYLLHVHRRPIVLGRGGHRGVPGRHQRAIHDQHRLRAIPTAGRCQGQERAETVDDPTDRRS